MSRPNWKHIQPRSLQHAFELCAEYALAKKRLTKDRIAEVMGQSQTWTLYKWIEKASMPANLIGAYELICGASYVTSYLAASNHKLLIDMPSTKPATSTDLITSQRPLPKPWPHSPPITKRQRTQTKPSANSPTS